MIDFLLAIGGFLYFNWFFYMLTDGEMCSIEWWFKRGGDCEKRAKEEKL